MTATPHLENLNSGRTVNLTVECTFHIVWGYYCLKCNRKKEIKTIACSSLVQILLSAISFFVHGAFIFWIEFQIIYLFWPQAGTVVSWKNRLLGVTVWIVLIWGLILFHGRIGCVARLKLIELCVPSPNPSKMYSLIMEGNPGGDSLIWD